MVVMSTLCGTKVRYTRLLIHLVGGDLTGGVKDGGDSSGSRFTGVVDVVQSTTVVICLVLEDLDQF
jgi:hypothetical protein